MAFTSFKKVSVSLFMLALLYFSFISDSVYVDREIETNALLLRKASLQNKVKDTSSDVIMASANTLAPPASCTLCQWVFVSSPTSDG